MRFPQGPRGSWVARSLAVQTDAGPGIDPVWDSAEADEGVVSKERRFDCDAGNCRGLGDLASNLDIL